nr:hypothetical protein [Sodalis glossinidius]
MEDQNTPLQVGDTLYVCTAYGKVLALSADSGKTRWRFDPLASAPNWQRCRGLGYYSDDAAAAQAPPAASVSHAPDANPAAATDELRAPDATANAAMPLVVAPTPAATANHRPATLQPPLLLKP